MSEYFACPLWSLFISIVAMKRYLEIVPMPWLLTNSCLIPVRRLVTLVIRKGMLADFLHILPRIVFIISGD